MGLIFHKKSCLFALIGLCIGFFGNSAIASPAQFTQAEQEWLLNNSNLKVAVSKDYAPISFVNSDGKHAGIAEDYLVRIQQQLRTINPRFEFHKITPSVEERGANDPLDKSVDMVVDFVNTPDRQKCWQFTKPYLKVPLHLIERQDGHISADLGKHGDVKIAVVDYYAAHELLSRDYPALKLTLVSSNQEGLKKVAFGEVHGFVSDLAVANYWASNAGLMQLKDAGELPYTYEIGFASSRQQPLLHSILEKSLANIGADERAKIHDIWIVGPFVKKPLFSDTSIWALLAGAVMLGGMSIWLKNRLVWQNKRITQQQKALNALTHKRYRENQSVDEVFKEIAQTSAETIQVERASIWMFDANKTQLECACLYVKSKHSFAKMNPLIAKKLPVYFKVLDTNRVIAVADALQDPVTAEFTGGYLQDNAIGAMLDGTIMLNGETIGVICLEHTGGTREWTLDEQSFAGSLADLCRISLETCRRRSAEQDLSNQQKNIESIVESRTELIERNAKLFRFLVERAPVTILYMDTNNVIIEMNPEAERLTGYSREYAIGKTYQELFATKDNTQKLKDLSKKIASGEKVQGQEVTIRCADGSTVDLSVTRSMELDEDGNPVIISIGQDLTRQKAFELNAKKLMDSESRYSYVMEHAPIPILILKRNGEIIEVNPEAARAFGASKHDMLGKIFVKTVVAPESRRNATVMAARTLRGELFRDVELVLQTASGAKLEHVCSIGIVTEGNEVEQGQMVAIAQNISQQKALEISLIKAREAAESADRIKSMFVASMSHELRTPLNSIIGFLGVVLQGMSGELNVKQKDQLGRAYHSSKHLLSLITDVIDISKIEAGFLQVHVEKFDLIKILSDVQSAVQHLVDEKQLQLVIECPQKLSLETDKKRLYQVILNVVSNGLKYSEQGLVKVIANNKGKQVIITVEDTGIGMDAAGLANLFKPFQRIESHLKIKTLGTGLGLYLTRKILHQLLGGEISVKSELGQGSIFTMQLPAKMPELVQQNHTSILEEHRS